MSSNCPRCILICVGSELLRGKVNTHASYVAGRLMSIGLALHEEATVSDEQGEISAALRRALQNFEVVLVSGGLGPTFDDLTREAASDATGRPLALSKSLLKRIRAKFRRAGYRSMPATNARQAYLLEGAVGLDNPNGTAPGQWLALGHQIVVLLPGPPSELHPILERDVLPRLKAKFPQTPCSEAHLHFVGLPESVVDAKVRPIVRRFSAQSSVQFTILARPGLVDVDVFVSSASMSRARSTREKIVQAIRRAVGSAWYGTDPDYPLEKVVGDHLRRRRATVATAESCTGGLLAGRLTEIPGSSDFFRAGEITYANSAKTQALGVPASLIRKHGAVSRPVAVAMARGIRERAGTTWGVGITGIAGPGGGTPKKPVGLVYIALASKNRGVCEKYHFSGGRGSVRERAVLAALDLLRRV